MSVSPKIAERIPRALEYLREHKFHIRKSKYESEHFGNFYVDLSDGRRKVRLINDRGQYFVERYVSWGEWEHMESYLKRKGVLPAELEANHNYDESRLLDVLKLFVES